MELFEHEEYDKDVRKALEGNPNAVLAKGKPQKMVVGGEIGGRAIVDIYTVAVLGEKPA